MVEAGEGGMAAPAGVRELLLRAHSLLEERSRGDPGLSRCRYHLDQCLAALESVMPFAEYVPPEGSGSSPHCCSAQAGCPSSTQSTQTVSTVVADAVSQANPTQAEQGSQAAAVQADATAQATPPRALGNRNGPLSENRGC